MNWDLKSVEDPLTWLAVMIVRGAKTGSIRSIANCIVASRYLGAVVDVKEFDRHIGQGAFAAGQSYRSLVRDEGVSAFDGRMVTNMYFGFWMPNGLADGLGRMADEDALKEIRAKARYFKEMELWFWHYFVKREEMRQVAEKLC